MAHAGGRPTKYLEEYCDDILEFFNVDYTRKEVQEVIDKKGNVKTTTITKANNLPTIEAYCQKLEIHVDTFYQWMKQYPQFTEAVKKAKAMQKAMWQCNSLNGLYRDSFTIFMGKNVFDWSDKQEITVNNEENKLDVSAIKDKLKGDKK